ncbi:MAG: arylsulfatase [Planctomycetaceae bacterium]|nr:arylsulfatase [Planctomycetaceae bacterium]
MADERPNIVLFMTDQWRGDCLGIEGHPVLQTPHVDYLGQSGASFRRAYSACPSCIPARRSLMTGTAPAANGMVGFTTDADWNPAHTLSGELSKAGYQTQLVGKLHLQPNRRRYGFDHMLRADSYRGAENDYVDWLKHDVGRREYDAGQAHGATSNGWVGRPHVLPEEQTHTFWCFDQGMQFLERRDPSCPFFLNISTIDPHPPLTPPGFYYERYIGRDLPEPIVGDWAEETIADWGVSFDGPTRGLSPDASEIHLDAEAMRCARAGYYGLCNFIDDQIGRFMQSFAGRYPNTLFIFTSDHGEMLGDHHLFRKCFPYEASARVPMAVRGPRDWDCPDGVVCDTPVDLQDIMPTCLDAAGVDIPEMCTGRSLLPIIRGETDRVRDTLHGEHAACYRPGHAMQFLTDDRYKYIWYTQTGREQLFDLSNDPDEVHDLARTGDAAGRLDPWRKRMIDVLKDRGEGFTDGRELVAGREHGLFVAGYDPNEMHGFL